MHTITLHSRIKFSRLDSNQRPFVYQTNALNQLSYVRMLEPLLGIEPRTIDYKSIVIPFNYRGLLHACKNSNPDQIFWRDLCYHYTTDAFFPNMPKNLVVTPKKNPELCSSGSFFIYMMIRLHLIKNPKLTAILPLNRKPRLTHVCREITYVMC